MTQFTPGPWYINTLAGPTEIAASDPFVEIGVAYTDGQDDNGKANAHLISAAPDMYKALERLLAAYAVDESSEEWPDEWRNCLAALKKARGES